MSGREFSIRRTVVDLTADPNRYQPAPKDHPWRSMFYKGSQAQGGNAMTPHMSGTSLDAQVRYAAGTKTILDNFFNGKAQKQSDIIVENGEYVRSGWGDPPRG